MKLFNLLSQQENNTFKSYVSSVVGAKPCNLKYVLRHWDKNKRKLYKLLGNNLKVFKIVNMQNKLPEDYFLDRLKRTYEEIGIIKPCGVDVWGSWLSDEDTTSIYEKFLDYIVLKMIKNKKVMNLTNDDICNFSLITSWESVNNIYLIQNYTFHGKTYSKGSKVMKVVRLILEDCFADDKFALQAFEFWRDKISEVFTEKTTKELDLVLSIHPLDFITLSDNDYNWSTCFDWNSNGCYSTAPIGLMNSNMAIVAYLKTDGRNDGKMRKFDIDNKSWRVLVFINQDICVVGKSYPYGSDYLETLVLDFVSQLAKENLGWDYQYKHQSYKDLLRYGVYTDFRSVNNTNKSILLYTNDYCYNDLLFDKDTEYICNRNYVDNIKKYSFLGQVNCMHCGESIKTTPFDEKSTVICNDCYYKYACKCCNKMADNLIDVEVFGYSGIRTRQKICKKCLTSKYLYDKLNKVVKNKKTAIAKTSILVLNKTTEIKKLTDVILLLMEQENRSILYCNSVYVGSDKFIRYISKYGAQIVETEFSLDNLRERVNFGYITGIRKNAYVNLPYILEENSDKLIKLKNQWVDITEEVLDEICNIF